MVPLTANPTARLDDRPDIVGAVRDVTELALRARDGDGQAVDELVRQTIADVRRYCGALVDIDSADDLTQQTYLKAVEALPRYRGDAPAAAWLLSIARHTCIDEIRRRQRRRDTETVGLFVDPPHPHDATERVAIEDAIAALDSERREAFVLTQVLGLSYAEAAIATESPIGTVRSRVFRARADLVDALGGSSAAASPRS
jgi:RNA polymerase sigma-70 factor (ECF subfamily)